MSSNDGNEKFIRQEIFCWCIWFHIGIFTWHFNLKLKLKIYVKLNFKLETYVIKKINLVLVIFCRIFRRQLRPTHPWLRVLWTTTFQSPSALLDDVLIISASSPPSQSNSTWGSFVSEVDRPADRLAADFPALFFHICDFYCVYQFWPKIIETNCNSDKKRPSLGTNVRMSPSTLSHTHD